MNTSFEERVALLRAFMEKNAVGTLVLRKNPNLAWFTGGRVHVPMTLDTACFDIVVTNSQILAITNVIEAPRLIAEEFPTEISVEAVDWWTSRDALLPSGDDVGTDTPSPGRRDMSSGIELLRSALVSGDQDRLREVSRDSAKALGMAMREVTTTDREIDVASRIASALWERDLELVFIGVAGESRMRLFRHPLPTPAVIGSRAVASICARRKGLIASVTRIVSFGENPMSAENEYERLLHVEAAMLDATQVGDAFSRPIEAAVAAYPAQGFDAEEWRHHHQGGPTGFLPRDWTANRQSSRTILAGTPIAWNPTAAGWKAEDTWLAQASGPELLSLDHDYPHRQVAGRIRPDFLRR